MSDAYWKRRFKKLEEAAHSKGAAYLVDLERENRAAVQELEKEITKWYQRFAKNNEIDMAEARQLLDAGDLAEFRWDVMEYIKRGQENAIDQRWMKELENASSRVHVSRLRALQVSIQQQAEVLFGNQLDGLERLARGIFEDTYYHVAFELQRGFGIGWNIAGVDGKTLDKVLSKPWTLDGKTFSDRIWANKQDLVNQLQTGLSQSILRGDPPDQLIKDLSHKLDVSKAKAGRVVMTESAYFASAAQQDCFSDLDVEQYKIVATLDTHTSDICQGMDGTICDMKDFQPGVTAPPFHPWCRSTTIPYFEDMDGERAARGEDGKTYYVPADMTYAEWKKSFVEDVPKSELMERVKKAVKKT